MRSLLPIAVGTFLFMLLTWGILLGSAESGTWRENWREKALTALKVALFWTVVALTAHYIGQSLCNEPNGCYDSRDYD